jgi:hypothetical protein
MKVGTVQLVRALFGWFFSSFLGYSWLFISVPSILFAMEEMFHCFIPTANVAVAFLFWLLSFQIVSFLSSSLSSWLAIFIFHFSRGSVNDLLPQRPIINTSVMGLYEGRINGLG